MIYTDSLIENLGGLLGIAGDTTGYLGESIVYRGFGRLLKILSLVLVIASQLFELQFAVEDLKKFNKNATNIVQYGNQTRVSNVNLHEFKISFWFYATLFVFNLTYASMQMQYECRFEKKFIRLLSVPKALFLEMPLLIIEVFMMKSQGAIDQNKQISSLIVHSMFIINLSISIINDIFYWVGKWYTTKRCRRRGRCCTPTLKTVFFFLLYVTVGVLAASIAYAPVSIAMIGGHWGRISQENYFGVIEKEYIKTWSKILIYLGYIGQIEWFLVVPLLTMFYYQYRKKR